MTTLSDADPSVSSTYTEIETTTEAKRKPKTLIEFDCPVLVIRKGRIEELYDVAEFPTGWQGRAFTLIKNNGVESCNVFVAQNGQDHLCDCRSFEAHGRCKHHDAIQHLLTTGQL